MNRLLLLLFIGISTLSWAQEIMPETPKWQGKFEQLDQIFLAI